MLKKILTSVISFILILSLLSGCSIDKDSVEYLAFLLKNTLYCFTNPYSEFIEEYNNKISPSENNQFSAPEEVHFKRLPLEQRMGYNSLDDDEKELYSLLEEAAGSLDNLVELKGLKVFNQDLYRVFDCFRNDCPDVFYLFNGIDYIKYDLDQYADIVILYYTDGEKYDKLNDNWEMESEASRQVIAEQMKRLRFAVTNYQTNIPDNSEYKQIRSIYEMIATKVRYDTAFSNIINNYNAQLQNDTEVSEGLLEACYKPQNTAFGAICNNQAVCGGFTAAITLLLNETGIINGVCHGKKNNNYHIWNVVKLNDKYYHLDSTNDKPVNGNSAEWMIYKYFLCDDEIMREEYEFYNTSHYIPPACSDKSLYINDKITQKVSSVASVSYDVYKSMVTEAVKNDVHTIIFLTDTPAKENSVNQFYTRFYNYYFSVDGKHTKLSSYYYHSEDYSIAYFYISY